VISLRERALVRTVRGEGNRVYKHAHRLREALDLGPAELALLSVLMLRGPQTVGELRTRSERQPAFATLAEVEDALVRLAQREPALVRRLERAPGRKEARWAHQLGDPLEPRPATERAPPEQRGAVDIDALSAEIAALREEVAALRARLDALGA
jgi:uncharacterized protein YceH (UPF0502 family)